MNVEFADIEVLAKAIRRLTSSVPVKDSHAISIQAEEEGLVMWRSNSEEAAEIRVGCVVHEPGALVLADARALDIAREAGELTRQGDNLEFYGSPRMTLRTTSLGFQRWSIPQDGWQEFPVEALKVYWANNPIGLGKGMGYLTISGRYIGATNRLAICWWLLDKPLFDRPVMFEPDSLIRGLLDEQPEVCLSNGKIWFRQGDFVYGRALTMGNDWTEIIRGKIETNFREGDNTIVTLHKETLLKKLRNVKHLSCNKAFTDGRCYVTLEGKELVIEGMATELGQITERTPVDKIDGPERFAASLSPGQLVLAVEATTEHVVSLALIRPRLDREYVLVTGGSVYANSGYFDDNWRKVA